MKVGRRIRTITILWMLLTTAFTKFKQMAIKDQP